LADPFSVAVVPVLAVGAEVVTTAGTGVVNVTTEPERTC
jgi:hypothetical protein